MIAPLWAGLAACLSVGRWDEPPSLQDAAVVWYSGSEGNASLGTHVAVVGDVDGDGSEDLALAEFGEWADGAGSDRLYIVGSGGSGPLVAADVALVELVGIDSRRKVAPSFAYTAQPVEPALGTLAWGSAQIDDGPGVVFLVSGEDLRAPEAPTPKVVDVTAGPQLTGDVDASRFGTVVVAADLAPGGAWELAIGAPGSQNVPGRVWLVLDPQVTGSASITDWPSAVELMSPDPAAVFGASIAAVADDTSALFTTRVSAEGTDAAVHGWLEPAASGGGVTISAADSDVTVLAPELVRADGGALQVIGDLDGDGRDDFAIREQGGWSIASKIDGSLPACTDDFPLHLALPWSAPDSGFDCRGLVSVPGPAGAVDLAVGDCPDPKGRATVYILVDATDLSGEVVPAERATFAVSGRTTQSGGVLAAYTRAPNPDPLLVVGDYADDLTVAGPDLGSVFVLRLTESEDTP